MSNTTKINFKQKQILAEFMSEHSDLAKGILPNTSQGKATANKLWEHLTIKLNSSGPPVKDSKTWRKVYADQKLLIKKKISFNKASKNKTGGGPYEEKQLSIAEEQILEAAGINVAVAGLGEVRTFGSQIQNIESSTSSIISQTEETDENILAVIDAIDDDEEGEVPPKKVQPVYKGMPSTSKEPRETKTLLLKKNINAADVYHTKVLERLDKIIEIKEKKLEMKTKEHEINTEIKRIELQIRIKELEKLNEFN